MIGFENLSQPAINSFLTANVGWVVCCLEVEEEVATLGSDRREVVPSGFVAQTGEIKTKFRQNKEECVTKRQEHTQNLLK